jgi:hypothetical protein
MLFNPAHAKPQDQFANETPAQQAKHREIAQEYGRRAKRKRRLAPKVYIRISDLDRVLVDRCGPVLPDDDAGIDDIFLMAHHFAYLDNPQQCIRAWLRLRAPWHGDARTEELIKKVMWKPLKWTADKLGQRLRFTDADRDRLDVTTIGGFDCPKAKRVRRRRKRAAARERERRAKAGAKPQALSEARLKPWLELGISESTYRRRKRQRHDSGDSNSCAACTKYIGVEMKHCQATGAPPPQGGVLARAVPALPDADAVFVTDGRLSQRVFPTAARETISISTSSSM